MDQYHRGKTWSIVSFDTVGVHPSINRFKKSLFSCQRKKRKNLIFCLLLQQFKKTLNFRFFAKATKNAQPLLHLPVKILIPRDCQFLWKCDFMQKTACQKAHCRFNRWIDTITWVCTDILMPFCQTRFLRSMIATIDQK